MDNLEEFIELAEEKQQPTEEVINSLKEQIFIQDKANKAKNKASGIENKAKKQVDAILAQYEITYLELPEIKKKLDYDTVSKSSIDPKALYSYCRDTLKNTDIFWQAISVVKGKLKEHLHDSMVEELTEYEKTKVLKLVKMV